MWQKSDIFIPAANKPINLRKIWIHYVIERNFSENLGLGVDNLGSVIREFLGKMHLELFKTKGEIY
jgi:hypothetical protein